MPLTVEQGGPWEANFVSQRVFLFIVMVKVWEENPPKQIHPLKKGSQPPPRFGNGHYTWPLG